MDSAAAEFSGRITRTAGRLVVWTMHSCNGRQAVMSALQALVLAGKGRNAFSVLFKPAIALLLFENMPHHCSSLRDGCWLAVTANEEVIALTAATKSPRAQRAGPKNPRAQDTQLSRSPVAQMHQCCIHLVHRALYLFKSLQYHCCSLRTCHFTAVVWETVID
jgi:hypothetical protein